MSNILDINIELREFKFHFGCYVHIRTNTIAKVMNPNILLKRSLFSSTMIVLELNNPPKLIDREKK